jgi:pyruvate,water dikinase
VLEQGGILSHPAIVAREYGLPAVVNVPHAVHRIRTGQLLLLDADRGRVVVGDGERRPALT